MKLLIGLGNPGPQYVNNRHSVGFHLVDFILAQPAFKAYTLKNDQQFHSEVVKVSNDLIIAKPQTFMNRSGKAVQSLMQHYKIHVEDVYIIHDDLDIALGAFKITQRGPQIHNGLASIREAVGDGFWKIRIGIENRDPSNRLPGEAYVLQDFLPEEVQVTQEVFKKVSHDILKIYAVGI